MPCTAEYFFDKIGITYKDIYASWRTAHKEQGFGLTLSESAKFLDVRNWPKLASTVRSSIEEVQLVHGASQKLAAGLIDALGELGDGDDFGALAPKYKKIMDDARGDEGFKILCNPVKTESLRAVFPSEETMRALWQRSSETVRASVASKPPPDVPGGLGLDQIEQAVLSAAQAAFGRVVRGRKGARFGVDYVEALRWLRDSVIWVFKQMWKHVKSFALVATVIFAVVVTYCMFMDREYTTHLAYDRDRYVSVADADGTQGLTLAAIDGREYGAGVCAMIYKGMDCIVRMAVDAKYSGIARTLDSLFGANNTKNTKNGHEGLAQWSAIERAMERGSITEAKADELKNKISIGAQMEIYGALTGDKEGATRKGLKARLDAAYAKHKGEVAETQRKFAAVAAEEARKTRERKERVAALATEAVTKAQKDAADAQKKANEAVEEKDEALKKAGEADNRALDAAAKAAEAKKNEETAKTQKDTAEAQLKATDEKLQHNRAVLKQQQTDASGTFTGWINPNDPRYAPQFGETRIAHFGGEADSTSGFSFASASALLGFDAKNAALALGSIILLGYLLGPVVTATLVLALGAGLFARDFLGTGNMATMQAVLIGTTVFAGLIQLMPVSSDEAQSMQALSGMVMHTATQVSDYRAQSAKAEADLMRVRDAASTATYASVAGGLTGVAALALTNDASAAARIAGAVHGGVSDTGRSVSEASAAMHEYNARFGDCYV